MRFKLLLASVLCLSQSLAIAQTAITEKGMIPFGSYSSNSLDRVNLATGNLVLDIPMVSYKQRGTLPDLSIKLNYNSSNWQDLTLSYDGYPYSYWTLVPDNDPITTQDLGPGVYPVRDHSLSQNGLLFPFVNQGTNEFYAYYWVVLDETGASHLQGYTNTGSLETLDGTGLGGYPGLFDRDGVEYYFSCTESANDLCTQYGGYVRDPNGNTITTNFPSGANLQYTGWTDSVGRTVPQVYLPSASTGTSTATYNYPGMNAGTYPISYTTSLHHLTTDFQTVGVNEGSASVSMLDKVTLPNGTA